MRLRSRMRRRRFFVHGSRARLLLFLLLSPFAYPVLGCVRSIPETHYYALAVPTARASSAIAREATVRPATARARAVPYEPAYEAGAYETRAYEPAAFNGPAGERKAVLSIVDVEVSAPYQDERIVYRTSPYRLDYYHYHQWSSTPALLIQDYLLRAYEASELFRQVTEGQVPETTLLLSARLTAFEEIDLTKEKWAGRVEIELFLEDPETGKRLWSRRFREIEPLERRHPEGLAAALSRALQRIALKSGHEIAAIAHRSSGRRQSSRRQSRGG